MVPEMPQDPAERPSWLRRLTETWPVRVTAEDEARAELYAVERRARISRESASSFADYLLGLEQRLVLSLVSAATVARAAQMHQRTNQFNLTTLRLTEPEIAGLLEDDTRGLAIIGRVADKFGDHGIAIAATVTFEGSEAAIRTLLMSCRVIGREIERAFLGELLRELQRRGIARVRGEYVATPKNAMVRDFYTSCGFEGSDEMKAAWIFATGEKELPTSKFVTVGWEV
jgi:FkbH-like protein